MIVSTINANAALQSRFMFLSTLRFQHRYVIFFLLEAVDEIFERNVNEKRMKLVSLPENDCKLYSKDKKLKMHLATKITLKTTTNANASTEAWIFQWLERTEEEIP